MGASLCLTLRPDDDGTGELCGRVASGAFSGEGSAWFNLSQINEFADNLLSYPLPHAGVGPLQGGYWSDTADHALLQRHFSLRFYPVNGRGLLGCRVHLSSPIQPSDRADSRHAVEAELTFHYEQLKAFALALKELALGNTAEAWLKCNEA